VTKLTRTITELILAKLNVAGKVSDEQLVMLVPYLKRILIEAGMDPTGLGK
jgi:hypothetical protein